MATNVKCETIDRCGWAGLRKFSGVISPADSKYTVPLGQFKPTMVVSLSVKVLDDSDHVATMPYFNIADGTIDVYFSTKTRIVSKDIQFELVVMGI